MQKPISVSLKLTNCLDCPHHKLHRAMPTGDSWDAHDVDVVCSLAADTHTCGDGKVKGRAISVSDRYAKREECNVPTWCPLRKVNKVKK